MPRSLRDVHDGETITARERREVAILTAHPDLTITWSRYATGERGTDLHVHREHTDAFYVLDGELTFELGARGDRVAVPAGGFVAVPPNVVHAFLNDGGADARWLNLHAPDTGFADYLRALRDGEDAVFDSFDPPADGGSPAAGVIVTGPGEGERVTSGDRAVVIKAALPELCVAEWELADPDLHDQALVYELDGGRVLSFHARDGGFADSLRR
jgi:quercetin dioxygenase-like cupin family protein